MERQKIYNAFDNISPSDESVNRMLDNILAASEISPERKYIKRIGEKSLIIAAVVIIMLLTMGAVVVSLKINDFAVGKYVIPEYALQKKTTFEFTHPKKIVDNVSALYELNSTPDNKVDDKVVIPAVTMDRISIQGTKDTPNSKALMEWLEFTDNYDTDHTLLREADANNHTCPAEYSAYGVYTQEMIDKLDEILEKYDLELMGTVTIVQSWEHAVFFDTLGIKQLHKEDSKADVSYGNGYFYECGTFSFSFNIEIPDSRSAVSCDYRYSVKGYFDPVFFCVSDINNIKQWNYTTSDGTELLIIIDRNITDEDVAWLLCEKDDAFITVNLSQFSTDPSKTAPTNSRAHIENITKSNVEYIADILDFNVKPQV